MIKRSDLPAYISPCYHPWRPRGNQFIAPYLPTRLISPSPSMYAPSNNTPFVPEYKGLTTVARPYSPCYYPWRPGGNQFVAPFLPTRLTAPGSSRILLLFASRTVCKFPLFMLLNKLGQKNYLELSSNKLKKRWKKLSASVEEKRPYFSLTPVP